MCFLQIVILTKEAILFYMFLQGPHFVQEQLTQCNIIPEQKEAFEQFHFIIFTNEQ